MCKLILQALILLFGRFATSSSLSLARGCLWKPLVQRRQRAGNKDEEKFYHFTTSVSQWVTFLWIVSRLKKKNPLCKAGMAEPVSPTATLWVSTKQDLNWVVTEIREHWALPRLTQARKLRVQKSPSAVSRVWELQSSTYKPKKALRFTPRISAGWCLLTNPIFTCRLNPEHRLGNARGSWQPSNRCPTLPLNQVWFPVKYLQK